MLRYLTPLFLILISTPVFAAVYTWQDQNGVVHFSDQLVNQAQLIDVDEGQVVPTQPIIAEQDKPQIQPITNKSQAKPKEKFTANNYYLSITSPKDQANFVSGKGDVPIKVSLSAPFENKEKLQVWLDDKKLPVSPKTTSFELSHLNRGQHQLHIEWLDAQKHLLASSETVTFYLQRPREKHV